MRNVRRSQWFLLALVALLLLLAYCISAGGMLLGALVPPVMAATGGASSDSQNCTGKHDEPSFGGAVVIDTREVECGTLTTFGGTVAINGEVQGDIVAFNSQVVIVGTVFGNIDLYGGNVIVQSGSHVHGDINLYGGHYTGADKSIDGIVSNHTGNIDWLLDTSGHFIFPFWFLLVWVGFGLLLTSLLPEHVMIVRTTVVSKARRSLVLGLLTIPLAPTVIVVLIALVLSIPLAIIVGLGLIAAWGLGTVAIGWLVGDYILGKVASHYNTRPIQIVVGLTVLVLAGSLPYIGWLISIGAGSLGLGAVFLSRFGTRLYTQPKQPIIL